MPLVLMPLVSPSRLRRGFTLVELLVVIAIIAIISSVLLPVFAQTRAQARRAVCVQNTRQLMSAVMLYTQDYDEKLPVLGTLGDGRGRWMWQIASYLRNLQIFTCPDVPHSLYDGTEWSAVSGYGWAETLWGHNSGNPLADGYQLAEIGRPGQTIALGDTSFDGGAGWAMYCRPPWEGSADPRPGYYPQFRHAAQSYRPIQDQFFKIQRQLPLDGFNSFAFLDGHTKSLNAATAFTLADPIQYLFWSRE